MKDKIKPVHPGEILKEEFLTPMNITQYKLANDISVSQMKISEIVRGKRRITTDTALRLSKYFDISVEFWLGIQTDYDVEIARDNKKTSANIDKIKPVLSSMPPL